MRSDYHVGTTWAAVGDTPVVATTGKRFGLNLISALSAEGELRYMEVEGRMNAGKFITFLERLIAGRERPVYLIVDGQLLESAGAEALYLPPYSPDLNPIEQAFAKLKHLLRAARRRTMERLWDEIGMLLDRFTPEECANYLANAGYAIN